MTSSKSLPSTKKKVPFCIRSKLTASWPRKWTFSSLMAEDAVRFWLAQDWQGLAAFKKNITTLSEGKGVGKVQAQGFQCWQQHIATPARPFQASNLDTCVEGLGLCGIWQRFWWVGGSQCTLCFVVLRSNKPFDFFYMLFVFRFL